MNAWLFFKRKNEEKIRHESEKKKNHDKEEEE